MTCTDLDLLYAATTRCDCGAGLAYRMDLATAPPQAAWVCARVLKGEVEQDGHGYYPFAFWKIREETSINNAGGRTTRPQGTIARTVGKATCPKCAHTWQSEPYSACGLSHHWFSGACPSCGYAVGGAGSWSSSDGPAIGQRFLDVVLGPDVSRIVVDC